MLAGRMPSCLLVFWRTVLREQGELKPLCAHMGATCFRNHPSSQLVKRERKGCPRILVAVSMMVGKWKMVEKRWHRKVKKANTG
ncbi:uncharacterized protein EI90DRAFT_3085358 [Cantharellus anzutake]|uniref:uncharacterized protein n=1 Tax=Cantharellus anzutake TaxID=1750568 RepID=UPI001907F3A7|nr:uncharacterized protein EI90DRAFT_3085358 [Cantharellus anzutake]KAF8317236.1 hypothetical protein EI90DRAFT_3085358 [Cantharellus anzutake]